MLKETNRLEERGSGVHDSDGGGLVQEGLVGSRGLMGFADGLGDETRSYF